MKRTMKDSLSLVLAGEAGQGLNAMESLITALLKQAGYYVFAAKEYMSRVRGGVNSVEILISAQPSPAFVDRIDVLIPLTQASLDHLKDRITPQTIILAEALTGPQVISVPFQTLATKAGGSLMVNTVAGGVVAALMGTSHDLGLRFVDQFYARKTEDIRKKNHEAFALGYEEGQRLRTLVPVEIAHAGDLSSKLLVSGHEAVALGAVAGGVTYVCAYPMSPGTAVLELLAQYSKTLDILVEQVEDEIGVVNMALGAWFAGSRALVTTSGGGFALMTEGVSMSGMAEIPLVVHIAQRPGPATGLPTRTEQGDLFLATFAGPGDFARLVLAPGDLSEAFGLSMAALEMADRFQIPVFLLTDQYFLDAYAVNDEFSIPEAQKLIDEVFQKAQRGAPQLVGATSHQGKLLPATIANQVRDEKSGSWIVPNNETYERFVLTADGLSPRSVPGYGPGVVTADSDEHDTSGHLTEDLKIRVDMVHKRRARAQLLQKAIPLPLRQGPASAKVAIVGWGSTKNTITEALGRLGADWQKQVGGVAHVHFSWVFPLPEGLESFFTDFDRIILVENNSGGHLGKLIRMETGLHWQDPILRYDGMPFSVEGLAAAIKEHYENH